MSASVELRGVSKRFGANTVVRDLSLRVEPGEFLTLLGPSGCGKTTLLRMVAGFEVPDTGSVLIDCTDVTALPPYRRPVNQVFQSYALFPHLTVAENIAFGLRMQRRPAEETARRVTEALALVDLAGLGARRPDQLSGGQRQRVALARAIAPQPQVLLLDEPLSALDAKLRRAMQLELKRLQRQLGLTFIFVTHDQEEALTLSDRVVVVNAGRIEQMGPVVDVYHRPATAFVADFLGQSNLLEGTLVSRAGSVARVRLAGGLELQLAATDLPAAAERLLLALRPEKVAVSRVRPEAPNAFCAVVEEEVFQGPTDYLELRLDGGLRLRAILANEGALGDSVVRGDRVWCVLHPSDLVVVEAK